MDHKNLKYFMTAKKLNCHQARWSLYLAYFDFKLIHHPGHSMEKPDVLFVRATRAQDSRRILSYITVCGYDTTHLQENPQRLE